jgi:hypothetical protein
MHRSLISRLTTPVVISGLALALIAPSALASSSHAGGQSSAHGPSAANGPTKIDFKLRPNHVAMGTDLTSTVTFWAHAKPGPWAPLAAAVFSVRVDGAEVATGTTDANGQALVDFAPTAAGEFVMKIVYAGDTLHKKAQRAQGFTVDPAPVV